MALTGTLSATPRRLLSPVTAGSADAARRLAALLLVVAAQGVVLVVVVLLLLLSRAAAPQPVLTPAPTPQSAPAAP